MLGVDIGIADEQEIRLRSCITQYEALGLNHDGFNYLRDKKNNK